jgi:hypothetical protein
MAATSSWRRAGSAPALLTFLLLPVSTLSKSDVTPVRWNERALSGLNQETHLFENRKGILDVS